jgi:Gas vesicle protein G
MLLLDRLLASGLRFVFDQIATAADQERNDESGLQEELLAAQMRFEEGEIDEEELAAIEAEILPLLREIRLRRQGGGSESPEAIGTGGGRLVGVEVSFGGDRDDRNDRDDDEG